MEKEKGKIIELSIPQAIGSILPAASGPHLTFGPDSMRGTVQFHNLEVGQEVQFEREKQHGTDFHPILVWAHVDNESTEAAGDLERAGGVGGASIS